MKNKIRYYKQDGTEYSFSKEPEIKIRQTRNLRTEMKQTAVDWLFNRLWEIPKDKFTWHTILEEAKEREKMQIESAHRHGASDLILHRYKMEQYYKDTYGEDDDI